MVARVGSVFLIGGLVGLAASFGAPPAWQAQLALGSMAFFALGALGVGIAGRPPLDAAARIGLLIAGLGSLGLAVAGSGAVTGPIRIALIGGVVLVVIGSLVAGVALARMTGRPKAVGFVLLGGLIPWVLGLFVDFSRSVPFFLLGAGILATGYVGVGLLTLGLGRQDRQVPPGDERERPS